MNSTEALKGTVRPYATFPTVCNGSWEFTELHMHEKCCTFFGRGMYNNEDCLPFAKKVSNLPETNVVDISHAISPFNIQECAYILRNAYHSFPKGTVHIVGVDSEISPENEHIVVLVDGHYFVSANSGVISLITLMKHPQELIPVT